MDSKKMTVDNAKIEAAFAKLQANPEALTSVAEALNDFFEKLNLDLNAQEKLMLLKGVFASRGESYFVSRGIPEDLNCTVPYISYECKGCPYDR